MDGVGLFRSQAVEQLRPITMCTANLRGRERPDTSQLALASFGRSSHSSSPSLGVNESVSVVRIQLGVCLGRSGAPVEDATGAAKRASASGKWSASCWAFSTMARSFSKSRSLIVSSSCNVVRKRENLFQQGQDLPDCSVMLLFAQIIEDRELLIRPADCLGHHGQFQTVPAQSTFFTQLALEL